MRLGECDTSLSKRRAPLKALLLLAIFSLGTITVNGSLLLGITDAQRTGSFLLTVSPLSIVIPQGANATSTVTVLSVQGFSGTVSLSSYVTGGGLNLTISPGKLRLQGGGGATSTATVSAAKGASIGDYKIVLTGTALVGKKVLSSSALLAASIRSDADFGVYASPQSMTVVAGFGNATTVVLKSINGFAGSVSLSAIVPFGFIGAMGGQDPIMLSSGTSTSTSLQVTTTMSTATGNYNITITGSSGTVSHSCILTVRVVDPTPESLILRGTSALSSTGMGLSLYNPGNAPIFLTSYAVSDVTGDVWTFINWTGPVIPATAQVQAAIFIGSSCPTCGYNGIPFAFQQFVSGHTYTITVTTRLNNSFTFKYLAP